MILLIVKASLAWAEVSAGAVAKADQNDGHWVCNLRERSAKWANFHFFAERLSSEWSIHEDYHLKDVICLQTANRFLTSFDVNLVTCSKTCLISCNWNWTCHFGQKTLHLNISNLPGFYWLKYKTYVFKQNSWGIYLDDNCYNFQLL